MRKIDTDALAAVARSLGVGAPATVLDPVDFDDGVLQQVLDVSDLVRYAAARAAPPGWVAFNLPMAMLTGIGFYSTNMQPTTEAIARGVVGVEATDVFWLYQIGVQITATAALADWNHSIVMLDHQANLIIQAANASIFLFGSSSGDLVAGELSALVANLRPGGTGPLTRGPIPVVPGSLLRQTTELTAAAGTVSQITTFLGRFLPAGVVP